MACKSTTLDFFEWYILISPTHLPILSFCLHSFCLHSFRLLSGFLSRFVYSFFKMFYVGTLLPLWECMVAMHNHPVDTAEIKAHKIRSRLKTKAQETVQSLRTLTRSLADIVHIVPFTIVSVKMAFLCKQGATLPHLYLYRLFASEHKTDDEFIQIILLNELPSANNCSTGLKYKVETYIIVPWQ